MMRRMILEHAQLDVLPDRTAAFEEAFGEAKSIIASMPGFRSLQLSRGIERPNGYLLLAEWETLQDHTEGFRGSAEYERSRELLHHFYDPFPTVEHSSRWSPLDDARATRRERIRTALLVVDVLGAVVAYRHDLRGEPLGSGGDVDVRRPAVLALWGTALSPPLVALPIAVALRRSPLGERAGCGVRHGRDDGAGVLGAPPVSMARQSAGDGPRLPGRSARHAAGADQLSWASASSTDNRSAINRRDCRTSLGRLKPRAPTMRPACE